jgi:hypothetical protein
MDRMTVALTDTVVLCCGGGITPQQIDEFHQGLAEIRQGGEVVPRFIFFPPADIYDFREAPPDVKAAANLLHEWFDKQPVMEPVE